MSHLHRHLAPISSEAWEQIEEEAKRTLKATLAARKLVDFSGPKGWQKAAVATGRVKALKEGPRAGVAAAQRQVLPLMSGLSFLFSPFLVALFCGASISAWRALKGEQAEQAA